MKHVVVAVALALSTATATAQVAGPPPAAPVAPDAPAEPAAVGLAPVAAPAGCDPAAVAADRRALDRERRSARTWNTAWAISYTVFAGAQVGAALAEFSPGREFDDTAAVALYIGAGKAVLGAATRLVLPLRVPGVAVSADPCVEAAALTEAHAVVARKEQRTFWLQLGGGVALHAIGGTYLVVHEDSWRDAIVSFGLGVVVSTVTLYTQPKASWRASGRARRTVALVPTPTRGGAGLAVVGTF